MEFVREGRKAVMQGFAERKVYAVCPRWEATKNGHKVVGVQWVDTAKGGKVRSRLVAQDFNTDKGKVDELFAATPPLLASRWLCSLAASQGRTGIGDQTLMMSDISKAFLYGDVAREVFVELPDEDSRKHDSNCIGRLRKSMYGLWDAPQIWQKVVKTMLIARGYKPLLSTQCTYVHPGSGMIIVAHVDDLLVLGTKHQLQ